MKHGLLHILGCLIPIALIFLLPTLGVGSGVTFTVFIVLMFACHLFMMGGHGHGAGHDHGDSGRLDHNGTDDLDHSATLKSSPSRGKQS